MSSEHAGALDRRNGGAEARQAEAGEGEQGGGEGAAQVLAAAFALLEFGAGDVHASMQSRDRANGREGPQINPGGAGSKTLYCLQNRDVRDAGGGR